MVDSTLKLYYAGPMQARAQAIRYALAAGGIAFEDVQNKGFPATEEDKALWLELGKNTTTNVPMLVDGNKVYTQSVAVLLAAGRKGGLVPADEDGQYEVDKLVADATDLAGLSFKALKMFGATPEAEQKYATQDLPKHVGNIERQLGDNEWFVGGKVSLADVVVYSALTTNCQHIVPDCLGAFPKLAAFCKRFEALPKIAAYQASEQYTKLMKFEAIAK